MIETIALCITAPLCAYFIVKRLYQKDTALEQRRLQAADAAGELKAWGLQRAPKLLTAYSVGDYSTLLNELVETIKLFIGKDGNVHILAELEGTFTRVLDIKLATKEGRDFVATKLAAFAT